LLDNRLIEPDDRAGSTFGAIECVQFMKTSHCKKGRVGAEYATTTVA